MLLKAHHEIRRRTLAGNIIMFDCLYFLLNYRYSYLLAVIDTVFRFCWKRIPIHRDKNRIPRTGTTGWIYGPGFCTGRKPTSQSENGKRRLKAWREVFKLNLLSGSWPSFLFDAKNDYNAKNRGLLHFLTWETGNGDGPRQIIMRQSYGNEVDSTGKTGEELEISYACLMDFLCTILQP